jgi:uncharacterized membrane protein YfcA
MGISDLILLLAMGGAAGLLAGFFGIGGGIIIVPGLIFYFNRKGIDPAILTHLAVGTSLATIFATGISSASAHHNRRNVRWRTALSMAPFVIFGTFIGAAVAARLHDVLLRRLFGAFELLVSVRLALPVSRKLPIQVCPVSLVYGFGGAVIGMVSALFGIGGGTVSVPVMVFFLDMPIKLAVGTSSAQGVVIAFFGTMEYIREGWMLPSLPREAIGFVDPLPALLIGVMSVLTAPLGARLNWIFPARRVSLAFAALLALVGLKLIVG